MPVPTWTDQSGATPGTSLSASNLNAMTAADTTEAQTLDTLGGSSSYVNNLNRIRYQLAQIFGGTWNAARAILDASGHLVSGITFGGHVASTGSAPTITAGAGAGSGATVTWTSAAGTDRRGTITLGTGSGAIYSSVQAHVAFAAAYASVPTVLVSGPSGAHADSISTSGFDMWCDTTPASGGIRLNYLVEQ